MSYSTPPLSLPAIEPPTPIADPVPRWCVEVGPCVGTDAYRLLAFDGEGYPLYELTLPAKEAFPGERETEMRHLQHLLDIRRGVGSRAAALAPVLRVLR